MKCFTFIATLISLPLQLLLAAATPNPYEVSVTEPSDFGYVHTQTGYQVGGQVAAFRYDAFREDFPHLAHLTDDQIDEMIVRSTGVVSDRQLQLRGVLISDFEIDPKRAVPIFHPMDYLRAGVAHIIDEKNHSQGLLDLKGLGLGLQASGGRADYLLPALAVLKDNQALPRNVFSFISLIEEVLEREDSHIESLQKWIADPSTRPKKFEDSNPRTLHHYLRTHQADRRVLAHMLAALEAKREGKPFNLEALIEDMRSLDYLNGSIPLDRAIKELEAETATAHIFGEINEQYGSHLATVRIYGVLALNHFILLPNGQKKRAATVIRRTSIRLGHEGTISAEVDFPRGIVDPVLGGFQHDVFGALTDFELPSLSDPRIPEFQWSDEYGHPIEARLDQLLSAYELGDRSVFQRDLLALQAKMQAQPRTYDIQKLPDPVMPEAQLLEFYHNVFGRSFADRPEMARAYLRRLMKDPKRWDFVEMALSALALPYPKQTRKLAESWMDEFKNPEDVDRLLGTTFSLLNSAAAEEGFLILSAVLRKNPEMYQRLNALVDFERNRGKGLAISQTKGSREIKTQLSPEAGFGFVERILDGGRVEIRVGDAVLMSVSKENVHELFSQFVGIAPGLVTGWLHRYLNLPGIDPTHVLPIVDQVKPAHQEKLRAKCARIAAAARRAE